ncbi:hypothetical protein [Roseisolibacter agri]|uniref:Uncharacterized protein n=1 Tax=Roseisolibacter agri TaxID=2014610 RepID=A0AA37Q733_9BACT|nr:hypothetical protein [Roseisolibacter agri]GLC24932.1 hypothetical protein rosag_14450 [Roseisolibacter agri]
MSKPRSAGQMLVSTGAVLAILSLAGFGLCLVFQWPSQFVLGAVADAKVTLADVVTGTVLSPPLAPWVILVVATRLAGSRRWWGTVATAVLCVLGVVFAIGGWGEAFGPANPAVPRAVLLTGGIVWMLLGLSLPTFGLRALLARRRG